MRFSISLLTIIPSMIVPLSASENSDTSTTLPRALQMKKKKKIKSKNKYKYNKYNKYSSKSNKYASHSPVISPVVTPVPSTHEPTFPPTNHPVQPATVQPATPGPVTATSLKPSIAHPPSTNPTLVSTFKPTSVPTQEPTIKPSHQCPPAYSCNGREACALKELFISLNGCGWKNKQGWLIHSNICEWYGITCDNGGNVIRVNLYDNNLKGPLPAKVSELPFLTSLELGSNKISSTMPVEFGNFQGLSTLLLDNNDIVGTIPDGVCNLSFIDFWMDCHGPVQLREVTCPCCTSCFAQATNSPSVAPSKTCLNSEGRVLKTMYDEAPVFAQNSLTGQHSWFKSSCTDLGSFDGVTTVNGKITELKFNLLTAPIIPGDVKLPSLMGGLTNLIYFRCGEVNRGSSFPSDFGKLTTLTHLQCNDLGLGGQMPDCSKMTFNSLNANAWNLSDNSFSGTLYDVKWGQDRVEFKNNKKAIRLDTNFGIDICDSSTSDIHFFNSNIYGPLPSKLCSGSNTNKGSNIQNLRLESNKFTGLLPLEWNKTNLLTSNCVQYNFNSNALAGSIPWNMFNFGGTGDIKMCGNDISNSLHAGLCGGTKDFLYGTCLDTSQITGTCAACDPC